MEMIRDGELASHVSSQIARTNPLEGGPVADAQMSHGLIRDTWGGYASRLLEYHDGAFSPAEILRMLGITSDDVQNPAVQFPEVDMYDSEFDQYWTQRRNALELEGYQVFAPEITRLQTIFAAIKEGFQVSDQDAANQEADILQQEIDASEDFDDAQILRCVKRDALRSGYRITASELGSIMLAANVVSSPDSPSELGSEWLGALATALEDIGYIFPGVEDLPVSDIYVDKTVLNGISVNLERAHGTISAYIKEGLALIEPAFHTFGFDENPLINGTESQVSTASYLASSSWVATATSR